MVGLCQVGELEINRKRLCDPVCIFDRQSAHHVAGLRHQPGIEIPCRTRSRLLAMLDQQPPQPLHNLKEFLSLLLHQHAPEQNSERAHIAPQRRLLSGIGGIGSEFGKPRARIVLTPKGDVGHGLF